MAGMEASWSRACARRSTGVRCGRTGARPPRSESHRTASGSPRRAGRRAVRWDRRPRAARAAPAAPFSAPTTARGSSARRLGSTSRPGSSEARASGPIVTLRRWPFGATTPGSQRLRRELGEQIHEVAVGVGGDAAAAVPVAERAGERRSLGGTARRRTGRRSGPVHRSSRAPSAPRAAGAGSRSPARPTSRTTRPPARSCRRRAPGGCRRGRPRRRARCRSCVRGRVAARTRAWLWTGRPRFRARRSGSPTGPVPRWANTIRSRSSSAPPNRSTAAGVRSVFV